MRPGLIHDRVASSPLVIDVFAVFAVFAVCRRVSSCVVVCRRAIVHFGVVDILCAKLLTIEYIDLAEQALQVRRSQLQ